MSGRPKCSTLERLLEKFEIDEQTGCWLWAGCIASQGYASFHFNGRAHVAHRVVYELFGGPIPEGLTLDHLCRVRHCVNPEHVEPVTRGENVLRGTGFAAANAAKTQCSNGHEYTPENTYRDRHGWRHCRRCAYESNRRRRLLGVAA